MTVLMTVFACFEAGLAVAFGVKVVQFCCTPDQVDALSGKDTFCQHFCNLNSNGICTAWCLHNHNGVACPSIGYHQRACLMQGLRVALMEFGTFCVPCQKA